MSSKPGKFGVPLRTHKITIEDPEETKKRNRVEKAVKRYEKTQEWEKVSQEGMKAYADGVPDGHNPYEYWSNEYHIWRRAWRGVKIQDMRARKSIERRKKKAKEEKEMAALLQKMQEQKKRALSESIKLTKKARMRSI